MKKILYTHFEGIDDVIQSMMESKELKKAITRNNLYNFWKKACGEKFANNSFPYGMAPKNTMIIACKNSIVAQELLLRKNQILENFAPYVKSLHLKVEDFRFDAKKWEKQED